MTTEMERQPLNPRLKQPTEALILAKHKIMEACQQAVNPNHNLKMLAIMSWVSL